MIKHERVSDSVYMFQSTDYAEVTAGAIIGQDMAVVIDTLPYTEETVAIRDFIEQQLKVPVRYVINTHYHADHTWGNHVFKNAIILSSDMTLQMMEDLGAPSLENAKTQNPVFENVDLVYPSITFESGMVGIQIGRKSLKIIPLPGTRFKKPVPAKLPRSVKFHRPVFYKIPSLYIQIAFNRFRNKITTGSGKYRRNCQANETQNNNCPDKYI